MLNGKPLDVFTSEILFKRVLKFKIHFLVNFISEKVYVTSSAYHAAHIYNYSYV